MPHRADEQTLSLINQALAVETAFPSVPEPLRQAYFESLDRMYRQSTRIALGLFTVVFDLFLFSQYNASPELVPISAFLRLAVFTPAVVLFLFLDRKPRQLARRPYEWFLLALSVAPGVASAIICTHTTSTNSMSDVRATSLILLVVGLIFRMRLPFVVATAAISCTAYFAGLLLTPVIPRAELPSVVLTEFSIALAVSVFSALLDRRDRMVFLLHAREEARARVLAAQNQGLRRQVEMDALTGVANRRGFDATLTDAWRTGLAEASSLGLIMLDIDHFKKYNDHYGHQGGDACLRRVAQQAMRALRQGDFIARYGGEEFAIILPRTRLSTALLVAERVRASVVELGLPHAGAGPAETVTISLGVASLTPQDETSSASLVEKADRRLYDAKRAGRNRVASADLGFTLPADAN